MSEKLKIAVIAPVWLRVPPVSYGGIEIITAMLADGLSDRGHDVTLFASGDSVTKAKLISVYARPQTDKIGQLIPEIYHVGNAYDYCKNHDFDIIHDHTISGVVIGSYSTTPVLCTLHGEFNEATRDFFERFKDAVYFNAISEYQRQCLPDLRYVKTVYNTIDFKSYPLQTEKQNYLLWLSRFSPPKGAHLAIKAAKALNRPLFLAGKIDPGHDAEYFNAEIKPHIDNEQICFLGEVSETRKRELMAGASCFIFPIQWNEPFGLVMLEAMAAGTPVVAFKRGAAGEVVSHGKSGFLVNDLEEMIEMIKDVDKLDPLECRKYAETQFSIEKMISGYIENYFHIIRAEGRIAKPLTLA